MGNPRFLPPETCPICGADVHRNALACPECGADERSGWSEDAIHDGLDLPDEKLDYGGFVEQEFGGRKLRSPQIGWFWWAIAVLILAVTVILFLRGM